MKTYRRHYPVLIALWFGLMGNPVSAGTVFNIYLRGELMVTPPECAFDSANTEDVYFGDVHETLIDNSTFKRTPIHYTLNCTNVYSNALKMTLTWEGITLNGKNVIKTNRENLGIALFQDAMQLSSGSVINFTYGGTQPALFAMPVKPAGSVLTDGGGFYGTLTMVVDYR